MREFEEEEDMNSDQSLIAVVDQVLNDDRVLRRTHLHLGRMSKRNLGGCDRSHTRSVSLVLHKIMHF